MIKEDVFYLTIKMVILNAHNQILLLKLHDTAINQWDLPGGRVKKNESIEKALFREIFEETGIQHLIDVNYIGLMTSSIRCMYNEDDTCGIIFAFYTGKVLSDVVVLSSEHENFYWIEKNQGLKILCSKYGFAFEQYIASQL